MYLFIYSLCYTQGYKAGFRCFRHFYKAKEHGYGKKKKTFVYVKFNYDFWHSTVMAGSNIVLSRGTIIHEYFQTMLPYALTAPNVVFQTDNHF